MPEKNGKFSLQTLRPVVHKLHRPKTAIGLNTRLNKYIHRLRNANYRNPMPELILKIMKQNRKYPVRSWFINNEII